MHSTTRHNCQHVKNHLNLHRNSFNSHKSQYSTFLHSNPKWIRVVCGRQILQYSKITWHFITERDEIYRRSAGEGGGLWPIEDRPHEIPPCPRENSTRHRACVAIEPRCEERWQFARKFIRTLNEALVCLCVDKG